MKRAPGVALAAALCLTVWTLALGSASAMDLGVGLVVVGLVLFGLRRRLFAGSPLSAGELIRRILALVPFLLAVAREIAIGTWRVALVVAGIRRPSCTGLVAVPMAGRSDVGVLVSGLVLTVIPGESLLELDWERRVMVVHILDVIDPDQVRDEQERFFERFQRRVFP